MNKKIFGFFVVVLALSMLTSFVFAKPWVNPKNNEDFETFETAFIPNFAPIIAAAADPEFKPSEDNPHQVITSWIEIMDSYTITVGGVPYDLGTDFEYSGVATITAMGAPFAPGTLGIINGKQNHFRVEYMYDFGDGDGGLDGTITMLALTTSGPNRAMHIRNLQGTGDFQNVQIQAGAGEGFSHVGIVHGWPE